MKRKIDEPTIHSFVLTDIDGNKTFAITLNFYREFYCCVQVSSIISLTVTVMWIFIRIFYRKIITTDMN